MAGGREAPHVGAGLGPDAAATSVLMPGIVRISGRKARRGSLTCSIRSVTSSWPGVAVDQVRADPGQERVMVAAGLTRPGTQPHPTAYLRAPWQAFPEGADLLTCGDGEASRPELVVQLRMDQVYLAQVGLTRVECDA